MGSWSLVVRVVGSNRGMGRPTPVVCRSRPICQYYDRVCVYAVRGGGGGGVNKIFQRKVRDKQQGEPP